MCNAENLCSRDLPLLRCMALLWCYSCSVVFIVITEYGFDQHFQGYDVLPGDFRNRSRRRSASLTRNLNECLGICLLSRTNAPLYSAVLDTISVKGNSHKAVPMLCTVEGEDQNLGTLSPLGLGHVRLRLVELRASESGEFSTTLA